MKHIVLSTSGSLGDVHPYIAIGVELKLRGHRVTIATSKAYRQTVQSEGLEFHHVRPDIAPDLYTPEIFRRANDLKTGTAYLVRELVLPYTQEMYDDLTAACTGADLLVIHPILFAAPMVAEKLRMKWLSVVLAAGSFGSAYDMPLMPPLPWLHALRRLGPGFNRLVLKGIYGFTRGWMKPIDELREREGLPPATESPLHKGMYSPFGTLACFSRLLGTPQPDWPAKTEQTGYVFYDKHESAEELDPALENFLSAGEPPIVFTLGTSAVIDPGNFYQASFEAIKRVGRRAVFLIGKQEANRPQGEIPPSIFVSGYAPYSKLFPRAAAVVHQGGAGTTAQTLRAGVPMLVVPYLHDQPDNAFRMKRLGVARVLQREVYNARSASENLRIILEDGRYAEQARAAAQQIALEDGVGNCVRVIERVLDLKQEAGVDGEREATLESALSNR